MCWCDPQKRTPWCDNCKDWHNGKPDSERRIHSISAQQIHERFNGLIHIEADKPGDHLQGFPPRTIEEKRLSELFCIVSDIIIFLEHMKSTPNRGDIDVARLGGKRS
jgi:hypothetical protein